MKTYSGIIKLACLFILTPIVIWKLALGNTLNLYTEKQKIEILNHTISTDIQTFHPMVSVAPEPLLSNGKLLKLFADTLAANQVGILSYTPEMLDAEDNYKLYCGKLVLSGKYIELVKMVSTIENANLPLKIASMSFEYDRKKREASKEISLKLIIEQIEH